MPEGRDEAMNVAVSMSRHLSESIDGLEEDEQW